MFTVSKKSYKCVEIRCLIITCETKECENEDMCGKFSLDGKTRFQESKNVYPTILLL